MRDKKELRGWVLSRAGQIHHKTCTCSMVRSDRNVDITPWLPSVGGPSPSRPNASKVFTGTDLQELQFPT